MATDPASTRNVVKSLSFRLSKTDKGTCARRGEITLPHGSVQTPAFMPVGTQGTVKGLTIDSVEATGAEILLGNTYHLSLRPTSERIAALGGLHAFTGWSRPILTDSGGFQIFSLADLAVISEERATFRSHIDGSEVRLAPEDSVRIQEELGSDIAMVLDHVIALPASETAIEDACWRSVRWAERCKAAHSRSDQAQFAIVQGGLDESLRSKCAEALVNIGFDGYAVGGLSVGETPAEMYRVVSATCPALPEDQPRYLMGVGTPLDLIENVSRGIDMFDCVMPTRNGRNALAFTWDGHLKIRNAIHTEDEAPIDPACPCLACKHSRAYLRHLFIAKEMLGPILLSHHNLVFYQRLMARIRASIEDGSFAELLNDCRTRWQK